MRTAGVILAVLILLLAGCFSAPQPQTGFSVSNSGVLSYPAARGEMKYEKELLESGSSYALYKLAYAGASNATIYGLLREVSGAGSAGGSGVQAERAAIVLLPGAGRTKEQEQELAQALAGMGYSTLSLDQRGDVGESKDLAEGFDTQYAGFLRGEEIFEYKRVYDVLRASDILRQSNHAKIIFMGESMGGRYSIIACAIEPACTGAVGISTSGYGFDYAKMPDANLTRFALSIDPDTYAPLIAPRKLVMFHSPNDPVIPLELARSTYLKAHEPRSFVEVECSDSEGNGLHGWCTSMNAVLEQELQKIVNGN
ncbi:MAG: alpha/beta hydrolase [Candidatus Burarchaeum sp.]|nr:alpha/beta hydrolase [Candidatus Burarchaeum sp.]MDO8339662.1 alpha/beta hydrolase [Candidatus Burarchaeum sp.]